MGVARGSRSHVADGTAAAATRTVIGACVCVFPPPDPPSGLVDFLKSKEMAMHRCTEASSLVLDEVGCSAWGSRRRYNLRKPPFRARLFA